MFRHYAVLALVVASLLMPPIVVASSTPLVARASGPIIGSMLRMELSRELDTSLADEGQARALLEFEKELLPPEIEIAESMGVVFARRGSSIVNIGRIYSAYVPSADVLTALGILGLVKATSGSKKFVPALSTSVPAVNAPAVWNNIKEDGNSINGSGITVAVIDTGAEWRHPSFWRQNTSELTVIQQGADFYVDLDNDTIADPNEGPIASVVSQDLTAFVYSENYMYIDVDDDGIFQYNLGDLWIGGVDANHDNVISLPTEKVVVFGESKISLFYDQPNNAVYVRGVNLTTQGPSVSDYHGHGSHVASTIAGGQPGFTSLVGVAPGADLIIIKSDLESSDILDGIHFAVMNDADIINMSFSSYLGFLDGTDIEDLAVSEALMTNGTLSTLAAGNLRGRSKHARFEVTAGGSTDVSLSVFNPPQYGFVSLLWHSSDRDEHVILTPPGGGDSIDLGAFSDLAGSALSLNEPNISVYVFADVSTRGLNRLIIQLSTEDHEWDSGTWTISVSNPSGESIWVDGYAWDNSWSGLNLRFSSHVDNTRTISSPGTADLGVTVASYSEASHSISTSSSMGPRVDGVPKPEVAAPGVNIRAASRSITSLWSTRRGTSMASPHVAGVLALIRQAAQSDTGWLSMTALLEGAGGEEDHKSPSLNDWGYGLCDSLWSVRHVLDLSFEAGMTAADWVGLTEVIDDSVDNTLNASLDILSVKAYQEVGQLGLAVAMRGIPDFTVSNTLTLEWDTDSNPSTGQNGVDLMVNVTAGAAHAYDWSGSSFVPSTLAVDWWSDTSTVFLLIERSDFTTRGTIAISTHNQTLSPADVTDQADLMNQWRPLVEDVTVTSSDIGYSFDVVISDRDDPISSLNIQWSVVTGSLSVIDSGLGAGVNLLDIQVGLEILEANDLLSVLLVVSDSEENFTVPIVALSSGLGYVLRFASAVLDQSTVRVGLLIQDYVTGTIVLEGYHLVDRVYIGFRSQQGLWLNFTLSGSQGEYVFDISASGFMVGDYDVYAVAEGQDGDVIEHQLGTLSVIEDNSMVLLLLPIVGLVVIVAVIYCIRSRRKGG
jgi:subtilisin family serine protease